ncbi:MAG: GNAT family N-acetyltransferase [Chloroflexi bacterium]|nr:GNAT family N-acetyltransferase [Chloroflexota bacterium]
MLPNFSVAPNQITLRAATLADAEQISALVNLGEREGQLIPRSLDAIRASIGDWIVALDDDRPEQGRRVIGVGSLVEMGPTLSEVRSLAVAPDYRKFGIGAKLVAALVELAREREIPTLFALTRAVPFFEKQGFATTTKDDFPEKVWRDCVVCPVRDACDEVAVVKSVNGNHIAS